ncbi:predicted transcriptional regulator [Sanguibacter keddieii DSM 10542]|uniref:Predicted transcriptional regulator n=1 Tax=Sanguibacter keddieii (strain ATCC 51767 / DSM 10542 / NCFB 3025 / ST-74) TaxID=446469 RepID=D1BKD3_SANKS|nr:helix-turn-helix transcriptional regulator [Sanguibacter keddieii]ACZ20410.1 predicted transcriptional regulator [Sanguibacter keddieii DSM 10542]
MAQRGTQTPPPRDDEPVFVISRAAELAGMHPQTLRQYDRLGIVSPQRSPGRGRRYSRRDVLQLVEVQRLSQDEGINLAGIKRILDLEAQVRVLEHRVELLAAAADPGSRIFTAASSGDVVAVRGGRRLRRTGWRRGGETVVEADERAALVLWRPQR